jgi:hypothetical protein
VPGGRPAGLGPDPGGDRPPGGPGGRVAVGRDVGEEPDGVAVEVHLVGGLRRSGVAQLGGTVGGDDDQRHAGVVGLEQGRMEVGGGRPRRAEHQDRAPGGLRRAEGEERRRPLVEVHVQADPLVVGQCQRQRRRPGPRRQHGFGQPGAGELVDEGAGAGRAHGHPGASESRRAERSVAPSPS